MKMELKTRKSNFHRADTRCKVLQDRSMLTAAAEPSTVPANPMILHTANRGGSGVQLVEKGNSGQKQ